MLKGLSIIATFLCCAPSLVFAVLDITDFVDPYDIQHVRIKSLQSDRYLLHRSGDAGVTYETIPDLRAMESHWFITASSEPGQYWIRNRVTGMSLTIENQTGSLEASPFETGFTSHRWIFEPAASFFRMRNAWQNDQYITAGDSAEQTVQTTTLNHTALNQRFAIEPIPVGATLPWKRYDETNYASLAAPAELIQQSYHASLDRNSPAAEAHNGGCILLNDFGTSVTWTAIESADALNLRYSILDGDSGTITLTITPTSGAPRSQQIPLDSSHAWLYFDGGSKFNTPAPGRVPAKRFADARVVLNETIQAGDAIKLSREAGDSLTWVDCLEAEVRVTYSAAIHALIVTDAPWNAAGDGVTDDTNALQDCINAAAGQGKPVYLPAGRYNLRAELVLPSNAIVEGAGLWNTELVFSKTGNFRDGGIRADGSSIQLRNLYIRGTQVNRDDGYHGIKGLWAGQSIIENIWVENTETGMWIADLESPYAVADGLLIRNCRIRNLFADGINLASGTRNTLIENCHVRSAGDDALATWSSGFQFNQGMATNNQIRYNTVECGYRAGALAVFGGQGHRIHHNLVEDQYIGAGIRGSTLFMFTNRSGSTQIGYPFSDVDQIRFYKNTLNRTGARGVFGAELGAIDFQSGYGDVKNISIEDIEVNSTHFSAIRLNGAFVNSSPSPQFINFQLRNIQVSDAPLGSRITGSAQGAASFEQIDYSPSSTPEFQNETATFTAHEVGNFIQFTPTGNRTQVSEAGAADNYGVVLLAPPNDEVTVTIQPDSQLSATPARMIFTPANWNQTQFAGVLAVDDSDEENLHSGSITHSAVSNDPRFTNGPLPDIDVSILDNDENRPPEIDLTTPTRVALPLHTGLLLSATLSDDGKPLGKSLTATWSAVGQPEGSTVSFDDINQTDTGVQFDRAGRYTLELQASDTVLSTTQKVTVEYGASSGSVLLENTDIGSVGFAGSLDEAAGTYTIRGSGYDVWNTFDEFHFYNAPFKGDGSMTIRLLSQTNTFPWAKVGLMIRDSLESTASHALLAVTPLNGMAFQNRPNTGSISFHNNVGTYSFPVWIRLERSGGTITAFRSSDGVNWSNLGTTTPSMSGNDYIGVFITSHNNGALAEARFDHLSEKALGLAPRVDAGSLAEYAVGDTFTLQGAVTDDGLPSPGSVATHWQAVSGISFNNDQSPTTSAVATEAGNYTLRLIADDGEVQSFSDLALSIITRLEAWQIANFGSAQHADAATTLDPDSDGLLNVLEYAFGGDPYNSSDAAAIRPNYRIQSVGLDQFLQFNYRRLAEPYSGITYQPRVSTSLAPNSWSDSSQLIEQIGTPVSNGDGTETVTVRLKKSLLDEPQQFVQLQIQ